MTSQQIRQQFLDFFIKKHGHTFVPSSPVVPLDDPTLLFTNAGMNQFKPIFLGQEKRSYTRAANTQKCIRAGGKHNDLDDVGRSRRHHTFFEMLGNWSFGDYFKAGAIEMAWELLTKVWKLDPSRLHVSCFEGDEANGVPRDMEAANLWKQIAGLPDDHIHFFGADNFWEMGDTGPCGPCSEIYIDRTPDKTGGPAVNGSDPRVMEIWNLVFIQYNRNADRSLTPLPSKHVDTGMGFERITQVLQNVDSNYEIDLFHPFWAKLEELSGFTYTGLYPATNAADPAAESANAQLRHDIAFRVIADHIRCLTFALTDGAVPSNEGRGYVLRRILRRAVRFGRQQLELKEPFLHKLVPVVVDAMGGAFPELRRNPHHVSDLVQDEEVSFGKTLDRGIELFNQAANHSGGKMIAANDAFKLHDTYGFPIDLTRIMAEERGMTVDLAGYEKLMEQARELARAGGKQAESSITDLPPDAIARLQGEKIAPTNDEPKYVGEPVQAKIEAIWDGDKFLDSLPAKTPAAIILNHTNFYAEMGGQIGDSGELRPTIAGAQRVSEKPGVVDARLSENNVAFRVNTTRSVAGYVLHIGELPTGSLRIGDTVTAAVSTQRGLTQQNHTATHIANWALREVLGNDVQQKGSLVDPEKLRFDFSHGKSVSDEELEKVEALVNQTIANKLPVYTEVAPQEQALKILGLRAVFGEKYPAMVRVVSVGVPVQELLANPGNEKWRQYSIEFCGGTHLKNSAEAERFVVIAEESVSKGVRRIVASTGKAASTAATKADELSRLIAQAQSLPEDQLPQAIGALQKQISAEGLPLRAKRRAHNAITELQAKYKAWEKANRGQQSSIDVAAVASDLTSKASDLGGGKLVVSEVADATNEAVLGLVDSLRKRLPSHAILLASASDGRVNFVAAVSDDLIKKGLKAGDWVKEAAKITGGGGGGRPQLAQAGGKDSSKLGQALDAARAYVSAHLK